MRVLLASDGSPDAMQAAQWLAASGASTSADILVLSVVTSSAVPPVPTPIAERLREEGRTVAEQTRAALGPHGATAAVRVAEGDAREEIMRVAEDWDADLVVMGSGKITETLTSGDPASEVLRIADENAVDLIVLGARGLGVVQRLLLGSVSEAVLHDAQCAVLIAKRPAS